MLDNNAERHKAKFTHNNFLPCNFIHNSSYSWVDKIDKLAVKCQK